MQLEHDYDRFATALASVNEVLGRGKEISEGAAMMWWNLLKDFDIEQVEKAFHACMRNPDKGQFMPTPADLIRELQGTRTDRSMLAWGKVLDAAARVGAYRDVVFDDHLIHLAVEDCGGWIKVCRMETKELGFVQKRFTDAYRAYVPKATEMAYPHLLRGDRSPDSEYLKHGVPVPDPVFIGNPKQAEAVHKLGSTNGTRGLVGLASLIRARSAANDALPAVGRDAA